MLFGCVIGIWFTSCSGSEPIDPDPMTEIQEIPNDSCHTAIAIELDSDFMGTTEGSTLDHNRFLSGPIEILPKYGVWYTFEGTGDNVAVRLNRARQ